ncbi:hypothetical protein [Thiomonas sp. FB-6]|uniref:hypothetical protein n=1 Tax=Thiomonas sp. FB-6 TaxID=1158291 RepID=UPI00035D42A5|nr:hypothetical protein [Thiomonas sp. FB-6]
MTMPARRIDVCNGDADGLCAVVQWRQAEPAPALLVTGLKRDIELLRRVQARPGDRILVCDLSMQRNLAELLRLLREGAIVRYFDHHAVDAVPRHPRLRAHLDFSPSMCSSLLVDRFLRGRRRLWALVGAYGDNLAGVADALALREGLDAQRCAALRRLGEVVNYNAYGDDERDVLMAPAELYERLVRYQDPFQLLGHEPIIGRIDELRQADLEQALRLGPWREHPGARIWRLPDSAWSRRVGGSLANLLAGQRPALAHAVLRDTAAGTLAASVRAPLRAPHGAHELCRRFGGAGRAGAGGIDVLPPGELEAFVQAFESGDWMPGPSRS